MSTRSSRRPLQAVTQLGAGMVGKGAGTGTPKQAWDEHLAQQAHPAGCVWRLGRGSSRDAQLKFQPERHSRSQAAHRCMLRTCPLHLSAGATWSPCCGPSPASPCPQGWSAPRGGRQGLQGRREEPLVCRPAVHAGQPSTRGCSCCPPSPARAANAHTAAGSRPGLPHRLPCRSPTGALRLACRWMARRWRGCASSGPSMWCVAGTERNSTATLRPWPRPALQEGLRGEWRRLASAQHCLLLHHVCKHKLSGSAGAAWSGGRPAAPHQSKASGSSAPASWASTSSTNRAFRRRSRSAAECARPPWKQEVERNGAEQW